MSEEKEEDSPYCPECGACGIDGCCPPHQCKYLVQYRGDYAEMADDWEAAWDILLHLVKIPEARTWMQSRLDRANEMLAESSAPRIEATARLISGAFEDAPSHKPNW